MPTIDHNRYYVDAKTNSASRPTRFPLKAYIEKTSSPRAAPKAGVNRDGSDAVYTMFGQNTRELEWFVKAGMTPAQALATATTIPAALLGHGGPRRDCAGYFADIVAVRRPLMDITAVVNRVPGS